MTLVFVEAGACALRSILAIAILDFMDLSVNTNHALLPFHLCQLEGNRVQKDFAQESITFFFKKNQSQVESFNILQLIVATFSTPKNKLEVSTEDLKKVNKIKRSQYPNIGLRPIHCFFDRL